MRQRAALTLVEIVVASAVLLLIAMVGQSFLFAASAGTARTLRREDALHTLETVLERIRSDVDAAVIVDLARDLAVAPGGQGLSLRVPAGDGTSFWETDSEVVTYALEPIPERQGARLVRISRAGSTVVASGLRSLCIRLVAADGLSAGQGWIVAAVEADADADGRHPRWASAVMRIARVPTPSSFVEQVLP